MPVSYAHRHPPEEAPPEPCSQEERPAPARLYPLSGGAPPDGPVTTPLDAALLDFAQIIDVGAEELAGLETRRAWARELARVAWSATDTLLLGPLSRGTAVSPVATLPLAVILPSEWATRHGSEAAPGRLDLLLTDLCAVLTPHLDAVPASVGDDALFVGGPAAEVALVPAFPQGGHCHLLPDGGGTRWRVCDMDRQAQTIEERDRAFAGVARAVLRIMHAWARQQRLQIRPFHLEVMCLACISRPPVSIADALLLILQKLPRMVFERCVDPADDRPIDTYIDDVGIRARVADAAFDSARLLARAIDLARGREPWAVALVRDLLGPAFPGARLPRPPA